MKKHYKHISLSERRQIYRLQGQGMSPRQIAQILGRHTSSIYREVWRNTHRHEERDCRGYYRNRLTICPARWRLFPLDGGQIGE